MTDFAGTTGSDTWTGTDDAETAYGGEGGDDLSGEPRLRGLRATDFIF